MRTGSWVAALLAAVLASTAWSQAQEFVAGDGTRFELDVSDGIPARAETGEALLEAAGFDIDTGEALNLTDRFTFVFKGGERPVRVRIEDITLAAPVLVTEVPVQGELPSAGFRRERFELRAAPCPIARGEPCSAWMFGEQPYRLYRVTLTYADRDPVVLLQAEPFQMRGFIERLGDRIPSREAATGGSP